MISLHLHPQLIVINLQSWLFLSFIYSASFLFSLSLSDPRITQSGLYCGSSKSTINIPTFVKEMETLSQLITTSHFATYNLNYSSTSTFYALAQCHQDLSQTDCLLCYAASRTKLPRCLPSLSSRIYLDGCFLRYDNYSFYKESVSSSFDTFNCGDEYFDVDGGGNYLEFSTGVGDAVGKVTVQAVENGGFAVVKVSGIYALAQCWDSVGREGCRGCLEMAGKAARGCVPKKEGRGMNAGCYLRYSTDKFYNKGGGEKGNAHGFSGLEITIAVVLAAAACLMLSFFAAYASCVWLLKAKRERKNLGKVPTLFQQIKNLGSLLQTVWQLYRSNRLVDAVDPCLRDEFPAQEASCVLQIGLLCTQASATLRPSMAQVVHFLTNNDCEIPTPNQPPYMNTSLLETENSRRSYSINSLVSNGPTEVEASSTSMESSSMHSSDGQTRSEESNARAASFPSKIPTISHSLV
ncbi:PROMASTIGOTE SURFACE ANTIGEN PROTEIN PSA [Salix purpurea]|uniref:PROMASTIGOTE SURFACE ANTIGEN PROTEIN PSA n=1 Tax=Salix purpurea TaxID=77065 RepID=A0A9Q0VV39_SALPP|nr:PROMASTIGOTE SURFACE ANTIGEN PROTEIN PSA [Salix purpurea]